MCDRERLLVPSAVIYAHVSRGGVFLFWCTANISIRGGLRRSSTGSILIYARAPPAPALIPHYLCFHSLSFSYCLTVFVLCENQSESHSVLPAGHSEGYAPQQLTSSCDDECAAAGLAASHTAGYKAGGSL